MRYELHGQPVPVWHWQGAKCSGHHVKMYKDGYLCPDCMEVQKQQQQETTETQNKIAHCCCGRKPRSRIAAVEKQYRRPFFMSPSPPAPVAPETKVEELPPPLAIGSAIAAVREDDLQDEEDYEWEEVKDGSGTDYDGVVYAEEMDEEGWTVMTGRGWRTSRRR
jgi:hypothetical protein